jgi:hypothetical protein
MKKWMKIFRVLLMLPFAVHAQTTLNEALESGLSWTTGGSAAWFGQTTSTYDGADAAQSGRISNNQESWMQTSVSGPTTLTYWWSVSSESGFDFLEFYLDGVLQSGRISGEVAWQQRTNSIPAGEHTLKWRYKKDDSVDSGQDAGWVDQVVFDPSVIVTNLAVAQRPGTKLVDITYDVSSTMTNAVTTSLTVQNVTNTVVATNLTGHVGAGVPVGTNRTLVWNMATDWSGNVADLSFTVLVYELAPCSVAKTGQTASYYSGDDGNLEPGVAWPNPRFTDLGDGTIKDNLTGLEWVQAPHSLAGNSSFMYWNSAVDLCNNLVHAGHSDWRLPSVKELESLLNYGTYSPALPAGHPFVGVKNSDYWSGSSSRADSTSYAWQVNANYGAVDYVLKSGGMSYVLPVRGGQSAESASPVPKTGQTTSYRAGDDGDLEPGVTWPNPRFKVLTNGTDQTVIDSLTGLEWVQAPHVLAGNLNPTNWSAAIDRCNILDYAGHSDWRLPSRKELMSLVDYGQSSPALPAGHPFAGVQNLDYWSGTTYPYMNAIYAWFVGMRFGPVVNRHKTETYYVWPVRFATYEKTTTIAVDSRDYTLAVASTHGTPVPGVGTNLYAWRATVTCSVASAVSEGGTNYTCSGWTGSGAIPVSGLTNNTGAIVLTEIVSSITWNWVSAFDIDGDGLPNAWELQYFGNATNTNPNAVCSNSINTMIQAYIAGLNPTNPASRFLASIVCPPSSARMIQWNAVTGRVYNVYWSTNLLNSFQPLYTNYTGGVVTDTLHSTAGKCFYKLDVRLQ